MDIGSNIKKQRKSKNMTQTELGKAIHKSESTIRKYESNNVKPDFVVLNEIADVLGCTLMDLVDTKTKEDTSQSNYLENYLSGTGYKIEYDEHNAALFLTSDNEGYEITLADIDDIKNSTKSFIQYKLSEVIKRSRRIGK
ncbi:helix-turn-helix domain-containing protein [Clostridium chromiireducens]|uniref:Helix-turn-helix domain-containing protein n=1 Tax=Clostridium chromiireducens TaxID=225345 RepID=A0A964W3A3_9CLOT|nr:helix-turn-helix transcriptional regulator [Clostridium chromiireducens]MVX64943.1 helix-turn-helix domain-containing protein [Clostridium chromiireducens]